MDFRNRNDQPSQAGRVPMPGQTVQAQAQTAQPQVQNAGQGHGNDKQKKWGFGGANLPTWLRLANVILLFSITVLAVSIVLLFRNNNPNEGKFVSSAHYQAVFLNNGQVYFGKIQSISNQYVDLQGIFYLNSSSSSNTSKDSKDNTTASNYTLVKLGCELHGPYDQMVINRDQVTFWENLKDDGQVVKTIKSWIQQNPKGQTSCSTSTGSTTQSTSNTTSATGNASSTSNTGTSSTSTDTTKKQ